MKVPDAWPLAPLGDLVDVLDSQRVPIKAADRQARGRSVPYYGATGRVGTIDEALFNEPLLLLGEDGVQFFDPDKPKAYLIDGPAWVNNHAHVLRARPGVDRRFLLHYLNAFDYRGYANGTTRLKLTQASMRRIKVPALRLDEQRRIADIIEEHLSHLDAAEGSLATASRRYSVAIGQCARCYSHASAAATHSLGSVSTMIIDGDHNPPRRMATGIPHLTAKAITADGRLDLTGCSYVSGAGFEQTSKRYLPAAGDVIVTCVGTIGRVAVVPPNLVFSADRNLAAIRCDPQLVIPEFVAMALRAPELQRLMASASGSTAQPHLYLRDLRAIQIPIPDLADQASAVAKFSETVSALRKAHRAAEYATRNGLALRRSILGAAFGGQLTGRSRRRPTLEVLPPPEDNQPNPSGPQPQPRKSSE